jgi:3-hydroxybutyryl-CoA dehydratase
MYKQGDTFEEYFVIDESVYNNFISTFKDKNPLHCNADYAISKNFKGIVMHGNILNGFISYFIGECLPSKNVIIHSQSINYKNAVYLNNRLLLSAVICGIFESVNAVEFKFKFKNEENIVVANGKFQIGLIK